MKPCPSPAIASSVQAFPASPSFASFTRAGAIAFFLFAATVCAGGQVRDSFGPHVDASRGCMLCHAHHSERAGISGQGLWGKNADPAYGDAVGLSDESQMVAVRAKAGGGGESTAGVVSCLSCHDGNLTPENMMESASYEAQVGLLAGTQYSGQKAYSLLEAVDAPRQHPVGPSARIPVGNGLIWSNGSFTVTPASPYARFVASYGWPALAPRNRLPGQVASDAGKPYVVCTTCHNQHFYNVYVSRRESPIASDGGGESYTTFFFVNGPYNPGGYSTGRQALSSDQFCRQCHFDKANEAHNSSVPTAF